MTNKETGEPTARPWSVAGEGGTAILGPCSTLIALCGGNEQTLTYGEMRANAQHIVRCVNAYEVMLGALEVARQHLAAVYPRRDRKKAWETVRAAIAKAKGE